MQLLSLFAASSYAPSLSFQTLALQSMFNATAPLLPADFVSALQACAALQLRVSPSTVIQLAIDYTQVRVKIRIWSVGPSSV